MKKEVKKTVIILGILIIIFIISLLLDKQIILAIQNLRGSSVDVFFTWILFLEKEFIFYPLIIIAIISLLFWKKKNYMVPYVISVIISMLLVLLFKNIIPKQRPLVNFNNSFPSGHATLVFAPLPFLEYKTFKSISIIWVIVACLFSLARVWFGFHYLSDIIGGSIIGIFISSVIKRGGKY